MAVNSYAQIEESKSVEIWYLGSEYFPVEREQKSNRLISINCKTKKCNAYAALYDIRSKENSPKSLRGGKNPGAVICTKYFHGKVFILRDKDQFENSFCKFPDGSILIASGLR